MRGCGIVDLSAVSLQFEIWYFCTVFNQQTPCFLLAQGDVYQFRTLNTSSSAVGRSSPESPNIPFLGFFFFRCPAQPEEGAATITIQISAGEVAGSTPDGWNDMLTRRVITI